MRRTARIRPGRRRGVWLAATAVGLAGLVIVSGVVAHLGDPDVAPPPAVPVPGRGSDPPAASGTRPPLAGEVVLSGEEMTWRRVCGVDLPVSPRYGPRRDEDGRAFGFVRGPAGAVLAGLHLVVLTSPQPGPDVFGPALAEQVTGPDAAVFADQVHAQYQQLLDQAAVPYGQPVCPIYGRFVGFLLDNHTPAAASLRLLIEAPGPDGTPQLASVLVQLSWAGGDWRLVAPPGGDWSRVRTMQPSSATGQYQPLPPAGG